MVDKQSSERFIELDGVRLHYNDVGHGPVLLCTHGGGPGASAWGGLEAAVPGLAASFRLLLLDLPNFGESQKNVRLDGKPPDVFVAELSAALLDALAITEPISYYASSGGSPGALRFALTYPERIHKLVIQSYAPGMVAKPDSLGARTTREFTANPTREAMAELFEHFVPNPARRSETAITARWEVANTPGHLESRAELVSLATAATSEELAALDAEVLFLWGASDPIVPVERVLIALSVIPRAQAHVWGDQTGHLVPFEQPEEFVRVVSGFLAPGT
jgi:2-hydroxy-6-oxonona-2,4-dienedioate hydrolase/4,5:9,10-diseco-3-hydroxy-5,9,17-trioxoandrosta-1(10),2-diene-4-oate hydrolase